MELKPALILICLLIVMSFAVERIVAYLKGFSLMFNKVPPRLLALGIGAVVGLVCSPIVWVFLPSIMNTSNIMANTFVNIVLGVLAGRFSFFWHGIPGYQDVFPGANYVPTEDGSWDAGGSDADD